MGAVRHDCRGDPVMPISMSGFDDVVEALDYDEFGERGYRVETNSTTYAIFVEKGTSESPAQPFMRPAFDSAVRQLDTLIAEADSTDDIARIIAEFVYDEATDEVPVRTGQLRDSITVKEL